MVGVSLDTIPIIEAPILLFVTFHKAFRAELDQVYRFASSDLFNSPRRDLVLDLHRRFEFLKLAYKYHCAAEDEVIFQALDIHVANIACTYSLEHCGIDDLFDSVFQSLNVLLEENGHYSKQFQELVYCTATIQTSICQHMRKEEEQVFPLLVQHFSFKEQASLVWQFFCSVPVILLEDFLPWMTSHLPEDEKADVAHCIEEVVPKEKLLQEVVIYWLGKEHQHCPIQFDSRENEAAVFSEKSLYANKFRQKYSSAFTSHKEICSQGESDFLQNDAKYHPVDHLHPWHDAIRKDLKEVLEKLYDIRISKVFSNLSTIVAQLKFLADIIVFYRDALENVFVSVLSELSCTLSFSYKKFPNGSEGLLCVLENINFQSGTSLYKIVEKLCGQTESLLEGISKLYAFQELEIFPLIRKHCNHGMQHRLLFASLHMMPLGLLKCMIAWLSALLCEDEANALFCSINLSGSEPDMSFAFLLHKWVCSEYSGKTSPEIFKRDLSEMFLQKSYYLAKDIEDRTGFADLNFRSCERFLPGQVKLKPNSSVKETESPFNASPHNIKEKDKKLYSSEINQQIFSPDVLKKLSPFSQYLADKDDASSSLKPEFKPIDYIFLFHKALTNDLNYLVLQSTKMIENVALLESFCQRFHLVQSLYQIHSDNEDRIAFPALEAKGHFQNISLSYTIDHKLEVEYFNQISVILDKISKLHISLPSELSLVVDDTLGQRMLKYRRLCMKLHGKCKTICFALGNHFQREEIELWPLFAEYFSDEEQNKLIGSILGNTRAEILQQMIPWLMASLSSSEQHAMMLLWHKATKNTMFDEWLAEWWEGMSMNNLLSVAQGSTILPSWKLDPLEIVATYLSKESHGDQHGNELPDKAVTLQPEDFTDADLEFSGNSGGDDKTKTLIGDMETNQCSEFNELQRDSYKQTIHKVIIATNQVGNPGEILSATQKSKHLEDHISKMSQEDLEAAIRRVYRDTTLDPQKKSFITQTLRTSRWTVNQQKLREEVILSSNDGGVPGQCPSYRDPLNFGCKHYKRNCKILASCCEKLVTCRYCHDDTSDHVMDRKSSTRIMCMKCLKVQPLGATCSSISCNGLSMAKYFCSICRLYDDEREIYHCPYCNLCRVGKGLGIDYFHCMNCNACMSKSLAVHICREKCFESNCPICHEDIFTSSSPVKALPCGHMMHSTCFQSYTCMHYTCPICSKSLGDMQVYFRMLDALLAEEKAPEEFHGQLQVILCNDCEKRGVSPFHWLYHKCPHCGSYNTRLL